MLDVFLQEPKIKQILDAIYAKDSSSINANNLRENLENVLEIEYRCQYRDTFKARLDNFFLETNNNYLNLVCGELGMNAFDHNLKWLDIPGLYFNWQIKNFVILIDRGNGVRKTLSKVKTDITSDKDALGLAFTERGLSGRSPEKRGNGLKVVSRKIVEQK
jgi:hypothetical protein